MPSRLEMLRSIAAQGSSEPFARYALAMELRTQGQLQEAWPVFEALLRDHPDYVAAYSPAAETLIGMLRNQEAQDLLRRGIELCERKGQFHARDQLQTALAALG
ncbi:MAG: tetratricopeptide repeat protein [Polyangia bacterium]